MDAYIQMGEDSMVMEDDSLTRLQETVKASSPSSQSAPTSYSASSPTAQDMKTLNLAGHLMGRTQGLVPYSGYLSVKSGKQTSPTNALGHGGQLQHNLVPRDDALSSFIEAGQAGFKTTGHLDAQFVPYEEYDAGEGFEGWFTNGENKYIRPNHQSHIDPHSGVANADAETWNEGFYALNRGGNFSLPQKHIRRSSMAGLGIGRSQSSPSELQREREPMPFKPPPRSRAIARKSPTNEKTSTQELNMWTTSYDTQFSPMNERNYHDPKRAAKQRSASKKKKGPASKRTFQWRRKPTLAQQKAEAAKKAPWCQGARKVSIPAV